MPAWSLKWDHDSRGQMYVTAYPSVPRAAKPPELLTKQKQISHFL